jgi:hypothetical protein
LILVFAIDHNPRDLIERDLVVAPIIEFRRPCAFVRRHLLSVFEKASILQVDGDASCPEGVATELCFDHRIAR